MKRVILTFVIAALTTVTFSQEALSKRAIYLEIGGSGIAASLNYEQNIWTKYNYAISLKGGLGYFPLILNTELSAGTSSAILGANFSRELKMHSIRIGISNAFVSTIANGISNDFSTVTYSHLIIPNIGYRYQKPEKNKLLVGFGYSPIISYDGLSLENQFFQFKSHFYLTVGMNL